MEIFKPISSSFDFSKITLASPQPLQGSTYFTKINYSEDNLPLYIQLPKCLTKQAFISTKRGKYCDLMYERSLHDEFIEWIEKLESICQDKIDDKKQLWFQNDFTRDDIETMMTPIARMYKSGKYVLIRSYINENKHTGKDKCIVYNENEINVDLENINEETYIIPLILIDGIKFTSRSFEIDVKLIQIMVLDKEIHPINNTCLIKRQQVPVQVQTQEQVQVQTQEQVQVQVREQTQEQVKAPVQVPVQVQVQAQEILNNVSQKINKDLAQIEQADKALTLQVVSETVSEAVPEYKALQTLNQQDIIKTAPEIENKDIEEYLENTLEKNKQNEIEEVQIKYESIPDSIIILKKPNEVYYEQYKIAKKKALELRTNALNAILEAKSIKTKYNLIQDSDSDDLDDL